MRGDRGLGVLEDVTDAAAIKPRVVSARMNNVKRQTHVHSVRFIHFRSTWRIRDAYAALGTPNVRRKASGHRRNPTLRLG